MFAPSSRNVFRLFDFWSRSRATLLDLRGGLRRPDDRIHVENFCQSWPTRLGGNHSDLQLDRLVQNRRPASMVGFAIANLLSDLLHHSLDRSRKKLW